MADFSEVTRQATRLCNSYNGNCFKNNCPLNSELNGRGLGCIDFRDMHPKEYEAIVMKWALEHPVMTNKQKALEVLAEVFGSEMATEFMRRRANCNGFGCGDNVCSSCVYNREPPRARMIKALDELDDMTLSLALNYAYQMKALGIDITQVWDTAMQNSANLSQAYRQGYSDAMEQSYNKWKEHNDGN